MTGWYPHVHGHRSLWNLLEPHEPNLLQYLSEAGYDIRWYGKNDAFAQENFQGTVIEVYGGRAEVSTKVIRTIRKIKKFYSLLYEEMGDYEETLSYSLVKRAMEYLRPGPKNLF